MAATVLTLVLAFVCGGGLWLVLGSRVRLSADAERNAVLNLLAYVAAAIVPAFVVVFYLIETL